MPRTGRPARIAEVVLEVLLKVFDELLAPRHSAHHLDVGGGIVDDCAIANTERADDVLLEKWDQFL